MNRVDSDTDFSSAAKPTAAVHQQQLTPPAFPFDGKAMLLVWGLACCWSFTKAPIPGINEPHYLTKAYHFWNPEWGGADLFLDSSNPHAVYYVAFGWLPEFFSFEVSSVICRLVCLLIFSIGYVAICQPLLPKRQMIALSFSLFLLFQALVNFSGEWVIGGAESKVISYGFGFWGIGCLLQSRSRAAALLAGLSTAFHPLVGGWISICLLLTSGFRIFVVRHERFHWLSWLLAGSLWIISALPGLLPALVVILEPVTARTRYAGDYLQVFYRLKHHLDPMEFAVWRYAAYLAMTAAIGTAAFYFRRQRVENETEKKGWQILFVLFAASFLIANVGFLLGLRGGLPQEMPLYQWRLKLLKFYPFRIYDLLAPLLLAIVCARLTMQIISVQIFSGRKWNLPVSMWGGAIGLYLLAWCIPFPDDDPSRMTAAQKKDWLAACEWIRTETPLDATILTPANAWAFKWYAERAEYVNRKDCPQEPSGIVEWNNRLLRLTQWFSEHYEDRLFSEDEMQSFAEKTGIDFLVARRLGPFEQAPVYENGHYRIYQISGRSGDSPLK